MMENDRYNYDDISRTILKTLNNMTLTKSLFSGQYELSKEMVENTKIDNNYCGDIARREITRQLSNKILEEHSDQFEVMNIGDRVRYSISLFTVNRNQLKNIVEAVITSMSEEQINRLRASEKN
jgi:hypothetical protein